MEKLNKKQRVSAIINHSCFDSFTYEQIANALCDKEFTKDKNWNQIDIDSAYELVCDILYCKANDC